MPRYFFCIVYPISDVFSCVIAPRCVVGVGRYAFGGSYFWGTSVLYHDTPLLLGSSIQLGQSVVADVAILWGVCGLVSVLRMQMVFLCLAAAVIDHVICRCGAVMWSAWADWVIGRGVREMGKCTGVLLVGRCGDIVVMFIGVFV